MVTPATDWRMTLPSAPASPPRPVMEETPRLGNMSEVVVKMLAENPWWAAAALPMQVAAIQMAQGMSLGTSGAKITGSTKIAQMIIAVLRALLGDMPRLIMLEESHPPTIEPMSARI